MLTTAFSGRCPACDEGQVFAGVYAIGNPIDILINPQADQAEIARATAALGLDKPLPVQYWSWLTGIVTRGDFGQSLISSQPIAPATAMTADTMVVVMVASMKMPFRSRSLILR